MSFEFLFFFWVFRCWSLGFLCLCWYYGLNGRFWTPWIGSGSLTRCLIDTDHLIRSLTYLGSLTNLWINPQPDD